MAQVIFRNWIEFYFYRDDWKEIAETRYQSYFKHLEGNSNAFSRLFLSEREREN